MRKMTFKAVLLLLMFWTLTNEALAETLESSSHVVAATVFADRALVTRLAKFHVPAGSHTLSVTDLPSGIDEASIRVQGKSTNDIKIGTVEIKHIYLTDIANAAEREKDAALIAKNDEKSLLEAEIKALETRNTFINRVANAGAERQEPGVPQVQAPSSPITIISKLDFAPEKWAQAWNLLQSGMAETQKQLALKHIAMRKLNDEIVKLTEEINQTKSTQAKERREAHINIEAANESDLDLSLSYQTTGATWRPLYDARLETSTGALLLEQYGQVFQITGEDWSNIELTFSTAQPAYGSEMPRLSEWIVKLYQPVLAPPAMLASAGGMVSPYMAKARMSASLSSSVSNAPEFDAMKKEAVLEQASVQATEYSAEFKVPGRVALKSTRETSKMFIAGVTLKATLTSQTSPRLTPQAFLFAKVTNQETYPLIPGTLAKYRDGAFIGNAALPLLRPNETLDLSFGVDDRVKVTYQRVHEEQNNPTLIVMGDMKVERHYQTKIQNLHKDPITITIFEQYPVAADPDVKSELLEDVTTQGFVKDIDSRQGVINWSSSYNPKEEKTFIIGFRVKYPKDKPIMGL